MATFKTQTELQKAQDQSAIILCIIGPSGTGKTTLEEYLVKKYGWNAMRSNTSRAPRNEQDRSHTFFANEEEALRAYQKDKQNNSIIAETLYGTTRMWMNESQIIPHMVNIFVVDVPGFRELQTELWEKRNTLHEIYSIFLYSPDSNVRIERCGGDIERANRNMGDYTNFSVDLIVNAMDTKENIQKIVDDWIAKECLYLEGEKDKLQQEWEDTSKTLLENLNNFLDVISYIKEQDHSEEGEDEDGNGESAD